MQIIEPSEMDRYKKRLEKARKLKSKVTHDYTSKNASAFTVGKNKHSVIYKHDKKSWNCDCRWYSMKGTYCSHILAVNLLLNEDKNLINRIMEKVKK